MGWLSDRLRAARNAVRQSPLALITPTAALYSAASNVTADDVRDAVQNLGLANVANNLGARLAMDELPNIVGTPASGNEYQQSQRSANTEAAMYEALRGTLGTQRPWQGSWYAGPNSDIRNAWQMQRNFYGGPQAQQMQRMALSGLQRGINGRTGIESLGGQMAPFAADTLARVMQQSPGGYQAPRIGFTPSFAGPLPSVAGASAPAYRGPALTPFTPTTPLIGFRPQTQAVNFQAGVPRVGFRAGAPQIGFQPRTPQVGFSPSAPQVGFQPEAPKVEFNARAPQVRFQPRTPQIEFSPNAPQINFQPRAPQINFQPQAPQIALGNRPDPTGSLQRLMNPSSANPYLDSMIDAAGRTAGRSFRENILPAITDRAIMSGQLGGSRAEIAKGIAARGIGERLTDMASQLYGQDYQQSMQRALQATGISADLARSADQAAVAQGQLGMQAQQLAGNLAAERAKLGLGAQRLAGNLASEQARLGIESQRLGKDVATEQARLGLDTQRLGSQLAIEQAKMKQGAQQQNLQAALERARLGLGAQQLGGQLAMKQGDLMSTAQQQALSAALEQARLGLGTQQLAGRLATDQARLGLDAGGQNLQASIEQARLGLGAQDQALRAALGQAQYGQAAQELGGRLAIAQAGLGMDTQRLQEQAINNLMRNNLGQNRLMADVAMNQADLGLRGQQLNESQRAAMTGERLRAADMARMALATGSELGVRNRASMLGLLPSIAQLPADMASNLYQTGVQQQLNRQAGLDAARERWDYLQNYQLQNLGQQADIWNQIRAAELAQAGMQAMPRSNPLGSALGGGLMGFAATGGNPWMALLGAGAGYLSARG